MNSLCLGFGLPPCDRRGSCAEPTADWVLLKVRMKALMRRRGGLKNGRCRRRGDEVIRRWHEGIKKQGLLKSTRNRDCGNLNVNCLLDSHVKHLYPLL